MAIIALTKRQTGNYCPMVFVEQWSRVYCTLNSDLDIVSVGNYSDTYIRSITQATVSKQRSFPIVVSI